MDLLQQAYERNLVQFGENVREGVNFICNCCGCCCEAMIAARKFGMLNPVHTSNFLPVVRRGAVQRLRQVRGRLPGRGDVAGLGERRARPEAREARRSTRTSAWAAACACGRARARASPCASRPERVITPLNSLHRTVVMAIERGDLQNLIFDNRVLWNHRALAAVLGVILQLPPIKQVMASQQMKSRYLEYLIAHVKA